MWDNEEAEEKTTYEYVDHSDKLLPQTWLYLPILTRGALAHGELPHLSRGLTALGICPINHCDLWVVLGLAAYFPCKTLFKKEL